MRVQKTHRSITKYRKPSDTSPGCISGAAGRILYILKNKLKHSFNDKRTQPCDTGDILEKEVQRMRIAAYCRVSTDETDQLNSLEAQKKFFYEYAQKSGDTLVRIYADEGISGTKIKKRAEFLRMMADAERGLFEQVLVKDTLLLRNQITMPLANNSNLTNVVGIVKLS